MRSGAAMVGVRWGRDRAGQAHAVSPCAHAKRPHYGVTRAADAVATWLGVCGPADPAVARREAEFSLRAVLGTDRATCAVHASESFRVRAAPPAAQPPPPVVVLHLLATGLAPGLRPARPVAAGAACQPASLPVYQSSHQATSLQTAWGVIGEAS